MKKSIVITLIALLIFSLVPLVNAGANARGANNVSSPRTRSGIHQYAKQVAKTILANAITYPANNFTYLLVFLAHFGQAEVKIISSAKLAHPLDKSNLETIKVSHGVRAPPYLTTISI